MATGPNPHDRWDLANPGTRGTDGPDSDIDLLVDLDVHRHGLFPVLELSDELALLLGEKIEIAPHTALAPHVAKQALSEAVPL